MEHAFVVVRSRGPAWDDSKPLEAQADWAGHAAFMDALFAQGFAALVGPLEGTRDALLVLHGSSATEVEERLARDPWTVSGLLVTTQISRWQIRLGTLARAAPGMHDTQHITVSIARPPAEVYDFASDPRNLPRWAAGLARSEVRRDGDAWIADAPFGKIRMRFAPRNALGVMDHDVALESGVTVHNPMRVVPNGEGSEFVFTLIRRPGMSDGQLAEDRAAVERDLATLKALLERR